MNDTLVIPSRQLLSGEDWLCPDCHDPIVATHDPEGIWIRCDCDAGYVGKTIRVEQGPQSPPSRRDN